MGKTEAKTGIMQLQALGIPRGAGSPQEARPGRILP